MPRTAATLLALALAGALAGCSGEETPQAARPAPSVTYQAGEVPVLVPGAPGEEAQVIPPGGTGTRPDSDVFGADDVTFMTDMVGHHAQALAMAELAPTRARDPRVKALAERIAAGQAPEIDVMQAWLEQHGQPRAELDAGHGGHGDMPGMATPEQMTQLVAAKGTAFDRLFLTLMTQHHEGALTMAEQASGARHPVVTDVIGDVVVTQSVEIQRMQKVLADLQA